MKQIYILSPGPRLAELYPLIPKDGDTIGINRAALIVPEMDWFCAVDIHLPCMDEILAEVDKRPPKKGIITLVPLCFEKTPDYYSYEGGGHFIEHNEGLIQWCSERNLDLVPWWHDGMPFMNYSYDVTVKHDGIVKCFKGEVRKAALSIIAAVDTAASMVYPDGCVNIVGASMRGPVTDGDSPARWAVERLLLAHRIMVWKKRGVRVRRVWFGLKPDGK